MKKILLITLSLFAALAVCAEQVTISWSGQSDWTGVSDKEAVVSISQNGIVLTMDQNSGQTKPTVNANQNDARAYAGNVITVSNPTGNITKIVFNISNNGLKRLTDVTPSAGTAVSDATSKTVTWTGDANSVSFTVGEKAVHGTEGSSKAGQICFDSVDVTLVTTSAVAMPSFSVNGGTFYEPVTVELSCDTEGASIYYTLDGTTPDATKTAYTEPIEIATTTTVKAIAIKGQDASAINEATYTIAEIPAVDDIAAFLATNTTGAAKTDIYRISCPVTVMYQYDRYLYITDGTTSMQVYGSLNNTYSNGDVLTGICGSVGYYNGTYQMTPEVSTFGTATAGTPVQPRTLNIEDITPELVSNYVRIVGVTVDTEKVFSDATGDIDAYKRFDVEIPAVGTDTYTIEGFVSIYKTTIQLFPTKIDVTTGVVNAVNAGKKIFAHNGNIITTATNETVYVYSVTGNLVATGLSGNDIKIDNKGIYIVKVGNKATKVVVR